MKIKSLKFEEYPIMTIFVKATKQIKILLGCNLLACTRVDL